MLSNRLNLRVAMVTDTKLIKLLKKSQPQHFKESLSTCTLTRYDGKLIKMDMTEGEIDFTHWITKNTIRDVDILDNEALDVQRMLGLSSLICFVDYEKESYQLIENLETIAPKYLQYFRFYAADDK